MISANENLNRSVSISDVANNFVDLYVRLRDVEERLYSDDALKQLPYTDEKNIYSREWEMRRQSTNRLVKYLNAKKRQLQILEVGCGNGWLSNQLAKKITNAEVTALDINLPEMEQGRRVFMEQSNLHFVCGDIRTGIFDHKKFDIIIFAASIQYFEDFFEIINTCLELLNNHGEIHILDSEFYARDDIMEARNRSIQYFTEMGFEEMGNLYFHHPLESLSDFKYEILYNPKSILNMVLKNRNPFRWICIKSKK